MLIHNCTDTKLTKVLRAKLRIPCMEAFTEGNNFVKIGELEVFQYSSADNTIIVF